MNLSEEIKKIRNEKIKKSIQETKKRRNGMKVVVRDIKLLTRHMNKDQKYHLKNLFIEAKQFRNTIIANDCKKVNCIILKDGTIKEIKYLSSLMKKGIYKQIQSDIIGLSRKKIKGQKIGKLKFVNKVSSIELKGFGRKNSIKGSKIKIQGIKRRFYSKGLKQIDFNGEISNARLLKLNDGYHVMITNYINYTNDDFKINGSLGIDTGIKNQLTINNGIQIKFNQFEQFENIIQKTYIKLNKKEKYSRGYEKIKNILGKKYLKIIRKRKDRINKLINIFKNTNIILEDINYKEWQKLWGKKTTNFIFGKFIKKLKHVTKINKYYSSTKICSNCGFQKEKIGLNERIYCCDNCGLKIDRDLNASINIFNKGIHKNNEVLCVDKNININSFKNIQSIKIKQIKI